MIKYFLSKLEEKIFIAVNDQRWREPKNISGMKGGYPKAKDGEIIRRRKLIIQTESHKSAGI
jgi:hypothetical protein